MFVKAINDLRRGIALWPVWTFQAYHEIASKYKRTFLGSLWIPGAMVSTSIALAIVMGGIQGQSLPDILPYVMSGIIAFALTSYVMLDAPETYMSSANIIKNHAHPFSYYTFESLTRTFIMFLHNYVAFILTIVILMKFTLPHWSILLALPIVYMNSFVWGTLASMMAARFKDIRFLLPFISQILFFVTPIFWLPHNMQGWRSNLVNYNPFYGLLEIVRSAMLGQIAPAQAWYLAFGSLALGTVLWLMFFSRNRGKIAFWV